jgi:MFS-type transporter involved in bile tolerance (Atg22 family)
VRGDRAAYQGRFKLTLTCPAAPIRATRKKPPAQVQDTPSGGFGNGLKELLGGLHDLLQQKPVVVFLISYIIFYFVNDSIVVLLVTQLLAKGAGTKQALLFTSGYMLAS